MTDVLAVVLVLLPPVDWLVAVILANISLRYPSIITLRERAISAVLIATVATLAGLLAWVRLGVLDIDNEAALGLVALALVLASAPSLFWLLLLVTGRFQLPPEGKP